MIVSSNIAKFNFALNLVCFTVQNTIRFNSVELTYTYQCSATVQKKHIKNENNLNYIIDETKIDEAQHKISKGLKNKQ